MARLARLIIPHYPHHILQRGNDRQLIFREDTDYSVFLQWLREAARHFKVAVHAYVLMPNHFHLLATPADETGLARMMQWVGRYYVPYFNHKYQRTGTLWQGRFKTTIIDPENYFLACLRYVELNPVRLEMTGEPAHYQWSSYSHHVGAKPDSLITDHAMYWALGNTPFDREAAYKRLVELGIRQDEIRAIREATNTGWILGSEKFKEKIARQTARRVSPAKRGRPKKAQMKSIEAPK